MNKELVEYVRSKTRPTQYDISKMNPSHTKLGPTHHHPNGLFSPSSWVKPAPLPEVYVERMQELGEKYQNLRWLPLNIPVIDIEHKEEFLELWNKEKIALLPTDSSVTGPEFYGMHIHSHSL